VLSRPNLKDIGSLLRQQGAYLISDEIYRDLYYTPERPESLSSIYDHTIVIGGLSKSLSMTGWRLGWLAGDEDVVKAALVLHGYVTTCASTVSQKASLVAWNGEAAKARELFCKTFRARRDHLVKLLLSELRLRTVTPEGAFYTMVDVGGYGSSMAVADRLLEHGVITVPGAAFGQESEGFLRVSFCADEATLTEGVKRIKLGLESL
jgi:aspartate/methionine/tyrosine aminotransferase